MAKKNILVIDDEESVRDAYSLTLEAAGYHVDLAEDGLAGLDAVRRKRPDMIFLDLNMPVSSPTSCASTPCSRKCAQVPPVA